jgi:preprotein translocase subunit YajC
MLVGVTITLLVMFVLLAVLVGRRINKQQREQQDQRVNDRR